MSLTAGKLHRSIAAMGFGLQVEIGKKQAETARSKLGESDQQFRVEVSGLAGSEIGWSDTAFTFAEVLWYAPLQRDSNRLRTPQVHFGSVLVTGQPVVINAIVKQWVQQRNGSYTGMIVSVGVHSPGATTQVRFQAELHVTVQGYGAPLDTNHGENDG